MRAFEEYDGLQKNSPSLYQIPFSITSIKMDGNLPPFLIFRTLLNRWAGTVSITYMLIIHTVFSGNQAFVSNVHSQPLNGVEGPLHVSRIVGGRRASDVEVKHSAHLYISFGASNNVLCGATVIAKQHVLTAAHCLINRDGTAASGVSAYIAAENKYSSTPFFATRLFIHRSYSFHDQSSIYVYLNDIAVIQLDREIPSETFFPVIMAKSQADVIPTGNVSAMGFGQYIDGGPLSSYLRSVHLTIQPFDLCLKYERKPLGSLVHHAMQFCASSPGFPTVGGKDTCNGDSGGPLYWLRRGQIIQLGITSWASIPCGADSGVAWYTNLTIFASDVNALLLNDPQAWTTYP